MKAQCDACHAKTSSMFCYVEEKALCSPCDHHIHNENSLVRSHQRVSFFYPVPKQIQICDICQETKAFIFCKEHRSILCRTCDISLHSNDNITKNHIRLILTGAKLCTRENQVEIESGGSTSSNINKEHQREMAHGTQVEGIPNMSSDDPYGLCKGEGCGTTFEDTDLGCYLSSLSPKKF